MKLVSAHMFDPLPLTDFAAFERDSLNVARREFDRLGLEHCFIFHCIGGRPDGKMLWDSVERASVEYPNLRPASLHPWLRNLAKSAWVMEYCGNLAESPLWADPGERRGDNALRAVMAPVERALECEINLCIDASSTLSPYHPGYGVLAIADHRMRQRNLSVYVEARPLEEQTHLFGMPSLTTDYSWKVQQRDSADRIRKPRADDMIWALMPGEFSSPELGVGHWGGDFEKTGCLLADDVRCIIGQGQIAVAPISSPHWLAAKASREELGL